MIIKILCDQTDCTFNKGGWTGSNYTWEGRCTHPHPQLKNHNGKSITCISKDKRGIQTDGSIVNLEQYAELEKKYGTTQGAPFDEAETMRDPCANCKETVSYCTEICPIKPNKNGK